MKRRVINILVILVLAASLCLVTAAPMVANVIDSSTMIFEGTLTDNGDGTYTGILPMTPGSYYMPGGPGEGANDGGSGGFDIYARVGGTAYVQGIDPDNWIIGADHDAYSEGGPWGTWYDPDCADWNKYALEVTGDHWYLRYVDSWESPMSGTMNWAAMYAAETDLGTQDRPQDISPEALAMYPSLPAALHGGHGGSDVHGGGAAAWDWDCGWGVEVVPLEYAGFNVNVEDLGGGTYQVTLTPGASQNVGVTTDIGNLVAISVTPGGIDFGAILPGANVNGNDLVVSNEGNVGVDVSAELLFTGPDEFYTLFLELNGAFSTSGIWDVAGLNISSVPVLGDGTVTTALVGIPPDYPPGEQMNTLVFWAEMTP